MDDIRRLVGTNVARLRLRQGLSQEELCERGGFQQAYLSGLEQGRRNPTILTLHQLARVLGVEMSAFFTTGLDPAEAVKRPYKRPRKPATRR